MVVIHNKHTDGRKSIRLAGYDYSQPGYYFVTICTKNRVEWFGSLHKGVVITNVFGDIVKRQWEWLAAQFQYVRLDQYSIMPDHIHGILIIRNPGILSNGSTERIKSLSGLIGAFKTTSSKYIHRAGGMDFAWQKSFHDHIIRNETSLMKVRQYIVNNPADQTM